MSSQPVTNDALGEAVPVGQSLLTSAAAVTQDFKPLKNICAHLNAFHVYADDPQRSIETNHYCGHVNNDVRQCLLYDSTEPNARLIGIEYMITPDVYETLSEDEQRLWHSHVYEVKSGMLVMPNSSVPELAWNKAEHKEMEHIVKLYGKTYHLWQTDKNDKLPLGEPKLMTSFTRDGQLKPDKLDQRDRRFGIDSSAKKSLREDIPEPSIHANADRAWKDGGVNNNNKSNKQ